MLGVDLELSGIALEAAHLVLRPAESGLLGSGPEETLRRRLLGAYSAKEAAFKALSPLLGEELPGLRAVRLEAYVGGYLAAAVTRPAPLLRVSVRQLPQGVLSWAVPHS